MRKTNAKGFYLCPLTGRTSTTKKDGWDWWDSHLEHNVYNSLVGLGVPVFRQFTVELLPGCDDIPPTRWKCDFILPTLNTLVEAKGEWINNSSHGAAKAMFLVQLKLARQLGFRTIVAGDKDFTIGKLQVLNYRSISWLQ